jgi:hypothetical protein
MKQLAIGACTNFIHNSGLEVDHHASWNMLASSSFREESVEGIITSAYCLVARHLAIRLNTVLQAERSLKGTTDRRLEPRKKQR